MKTLRYRIGNAVKPGILDAEENICDASSLVSDWDSDNVTVEKLSEIKNIIRRLLGGSLLNEYKKTNTGQCHK